MFHFAGLSSMHYEFTHGYTDMTLYGLPHSDIPGSKPACGSPRLFAANRVLHRLLAPRHPPYALTNLTIPDASLSANTAGASSRRSVTYRCTLPRGPPRFPCLDRKIRRQSALFLGQCPWPFSSRQSVLAFATCERENKHAFPFLTRLFRSWLRQ